MTSLQAEQSLRRRSRRNFLVAQTSNNQEKKKLKEMLTNLDKQSHDNEQLLDQNLIQLRRHMLYDNLFLTDSIVDVEDLTSDPIYSRGRVNFDKNILDRRKLLDKRTELLEEQRRTNQPAKTFLSEREGASSCKMGLCGSHCNHFPCVIPSTYQFLSPQGNTLRLFQNYVRQMPDYKRQSLATIYSTDSHAPEMVTHSQVLANQTVRAFHPVERAKALLQHHHVRKSRAMDDLPIPRENLYGQPFPKPKSVKAMWMR